MRRRRRREEGNVPVEACATVTIALLKEFIRAFHWGFPPKLLLRNKSVTLGLIELYWRYTYESTDCSGTEAALSFIKENISVRGVSLTHCFFKAAAGKYRSQICFTCHS